MDQYYNSLIQHKYTGKFVIKNFGDYIRRTNDPTAGRTFEFALANFFEKDILRVQLKLRIHQPHVSYDEFLSFRLSLKYSFTQVMIKLSFYLIDSENVKCHQCTRKFLRYLADQELMFDKFMDTAIIEKNTKRFMPNNNLTLGCELIIYQETAKTLPIVSLKYRSTMSEQLKKLLEDDTHSDFTFIVGDREFKVHKLILLARSKVFKVMFDINMMEKRTNKSTVTDIRAEIFDKMIKFIYTDKIDDNLNNNDAIDMLMAAEKYQLDDLKEFCAHIIYKTIDADNALTYLSLAKQCNAQTFMQNVQNFIEFNRGEVFRQLDLDYLADNLDVFTSFKKPKV